MNSIFQNSMRSNLMFLGFLSCFIILYGAYLFSFTLFEGYSTLSSDSFGYVLLARKWSPYFLPSNAELLTWPAQTYPAGFAWLLAVTGASESSYAGHLVVSVAMLISIALMGWWAYRELGWAIGFLLTVSLALLPGAVWSSMSILSENSYLVFTLAALLLYTFIRKNENCGPVWYFMLLLCLLAALLTRTIGIALVAALMTVSLFDSNLLKQKRIIFLLIGLVSIGGWQLWDLVDPQSKEASYMTFLRPALGTENMALSERLIYFFGFVRINLFSMMEAWPNYISPIFSNIWFSLFAYALLVFCLIATLLRALRLKLDAIYVVFYLCILLVWPYPQEMPRFMHPVIMLVLAQPLFLLRSNAQNGSKAPFKSVAIPFVVLLIFNGLLAQKQLLELRSEARTKYPAITHSREYYSLRDRRDAVNRSIVFQNTLSLMKSSKEIIPEKSMVASVGHASFLIVADRPGINLSTIVPINQQLCNLKIANVDYIFITDVTTAYNPWGLRLFEAYEEYASYVWSVKDDAGNAIVHILQLNDAKIDPILDASGFECHQFKDRPST
jgi:4-amino-4-deoxy-L-arabinose transferase-like glycosyltransferase